MAFQNVEPVHKFVQLPDFDMFNTTSKAGCFMDEKQLQAQADKLAKNHKTPEDFNQFDRLFSVGNAP